MNTKLCRNLLQFIHTDLISRFSSPPFTSLDNQHRLPFWVYGFHHSLYLPPKTSSTFNLSFASRHLYTITTITNPSPQDIHSGKHQELAQSDSNGEVKPKGEDEAEPETGDGGVVLQNCPWGDKVLSIAQDVLLHFGDDIEIFAFKISPKGNIYVKLDRTCNEYRFLSMEDIRSYSQEYKRKLDEAGAAGDIPCDMALEVSSPDADRLLKIPDDLQRFKNMAMQVKYVEHDDPKSIKKEGVFFLESIEMDSGSCVWRLADVKENRSSKGRPLTRKQKDWRLKLPCKMLEQVTLYLDYQ